MVIQLKMTNRENESMTFMVSIYKTKKKEGLYLYVPKQTGIKNIQKDVLNTFGIPIYVMDLLLTSEKKLARAAVENVITQIRKTGYYLQLPPDAHQIIYTENHTTVQSKQTTIKKTTEKVAQATCVE